MRTERNFPCVWAFAKHGPGEGLPREGSRDWGRKQGEDSVVSLLFICLLLCALAFLTARSEV